MEPGELIFIETSGEDAPSTLMLVVNTKREEGYVLFGRLIPAVRREMGSLGQWMQVQGESRVPEYKLVRASMAHLLEEAVRVLMQEGWDLHEGTVFHQGKYLQWMWRMPQLGKTWSEAEVSAIAKAWSDPAVISVA